jgi:hypothetical protein
MIIIEDQKFIETKFSDEQEIEDLVIKYFEHFFGPSSIFIPKAKIETYDGFATIPDGFAIDLDTRVWFLVEAELGHHSLWNHIVPQITKQLTSISRPETVQLISEIVVQMIGDDPSIQDKFIDEGINTIDIRRVLTEIFENSPVVAIPIDSISRDLEQWARTLKNDVRLWIVKKYSEFGNSKNIAFEIPEEFSPTLEISETQTESKIGITVYNVSILDLLNNRLLNAGQELKMVYGPIGKNKKTFTATLNNDGSLTVDGNNFSSPSYAALYCIKAAGSNRDTVNGWTKWKTDTGEFLSEIRTRYLEISELDDKERIDDLS